MTKNRKIAFKAEESSELAQVGAGNLKELWVGEPAVWMKEETSVGPQICR